MREVEGDPEDEPSPEERRRQRVEADRRGREREREEHEHERRRRGDGGLERPLPALPRDDAAGAEERRRPDSHQARRERGVEERAGPVAGLEEVVRERREDERLDHRREDEEAGARQALHVQEPADPGQPQDADHATSSAARCLLTRSISRMKLYPAAT